MSESDTANFLHSQQSQQPNPSLSTQSSEYLTFDEYVTLRLTTHTTAASSTSSSIRSNSTSTSTLSYGLYAQQLQSFLQIFTRKQIIIFSFEFVINKPTEAISRLEYFLNLKRRKKQKLPLTNERHAHYIPMSCTSRDNLGIFYELSNKALYDISTMSGRPVAEPKFEQFNNSKIKCIP